MIIFLTHIINYSLQLVKGFKMSNNLVQFVSGSISGFAQVFIMQPFEIVKIRLVNQSKIKPDYLGIFDCVKKIIKSDGVSGFYKGTLSPLLGIGPQVALQFGTNQCVKKAIHKLNQNSNQYRKLNIYEALASGFLTGVPSAFLVTPIDLTRIQMQIKDNRRYRSSIHCAKQLIREKGIRGLYLGFYSTLLREIIALSVYFGWYEHGKNLWISKYEQSQLLPFSVSFMLGGISGAASWLFTYPIDYIKTVIQSQNTQKLEFRSATHCMIQKYRQQGMTTFFKGLGVTMARSFPVNGIGFVFFQLSMRFLNRNNRQNNKEE